MADDLDAAYSDLFGAGSPGQRNAVAAVGSNPDDAAKAMSLSSATGIPAEQIHSDVPGYAAQTQRQASADMISANPTLGLFTADSMHARVSSDDLGALDRVSGHVKAATQPSFWQQAKDFLYEPLRRAGEGFAEGFDLEGQKADLDRLSTYLDSPYIHPLLRGGAGTAAMGLSALLHLPGAVTGAATGAVAGVAKDLGASEMEAQNLQTSLGQTADFLMTDAGAHGAMHPATATPEARFQIEYARDAAKPFVDAGEPPPRGVSPVLDSVHAAQNAKDLESLNAALGEAQNSLTRKRAPEAFKAFIQQHTDGKIGISPDAVNALHGGKIPAPGEGPLGFVEDLPGQMLRSLVTGQDIKVPMADWLTSVDPADAKTLEPFVRTRPEGVTAEEARTSAGAVLDSADPEAMIRAQAGLPDGWGSIDDVRPAKTFPYVDSGFVDSDAPYPQQRVIKGGAESGGDLVYTGRYSVDTGELDDKGRRKFGSVDRYHDLGQPESLGDMIEAFRALSKPFADGDPSDANSLAMSGVFKKLGIDDTPVYSLDPDHPMNTNALGRYFTDSGAITLKQTDDYPQMLKTTVHEGLHAAFYKALSNDEAARSSVFEMLKVARQADVDPLRSRWVRVLDEEASRVRLYSHYGLSNVDEFVSEAFSSTDFQQHLASIPVTPDMLAKFGLQDLPRSRLSNLWDLFKQAVSKALGIERKLGVNNLLDAAMEAGDRLTQSAIENAGRPQKPRNMWNSRGFASLAQERDPIADRARSIGMNRDQLTRYRDLIGKQREEAAQARNAELLREERKRQTPEWKAQRDAMRPQVAEDIRNRSDIAGLKQLDAGVKLDTDELTPAQREALVGYHSRGGIDPSDFANSIGYETPEQMAREIAALKADRGGSRVVDHNRRLISEELDRRMEAEHGKLDDNIVAAARDRVLSETQMQVLQAENEAAGSPFTKAQMEANVREQVAGMKMGSAKASESITSAGKAGSAIEDALLKGDAAEAFAQRARQYNNLLAAKELAKVEKERAAFDKTAKRYAERVVAGASQEYTDQIHGLMLKLGLPVKRSVQDIEASLEKSGYAGQVDVDGQEMTPFQGFVGTKTAQLRDLFVPPWLMDDSLRTTIDGLTVEQFRELNKAMKALTFNSREEQRVTRAGEKADFTEVRDEMIDRLQELGPARVKSASDNPRSIGNVARHAFWGLVVTEKLLNRIDRGDRQGVFFQTLTREYTDAINYKDRLVREYSDRFKEFGRIEGFDQPIENNLFVDHSTGGRLAMTKGDALGVLQYVGNKDNFRKLTQGEKVSPEAVMDFLRQHTTKEDWDRAQKIGDMFEELVEHADNMSRNLSGVGIDRVKIEPVTGPFGEYKGWYSPVAYDRDRPGTSRKLMTRDIETEGYYRATTPQSYTKSRTGYAAPVQLNMNIVPQRMLQMIHDIAMRPAVLQLGKFFTDPKFTNAVSTYYGRAQADQLMPFLRDLANAPNYKSETAKVGEAALRGLASNMTSTLVGANPYTMIKHSGTAAIKSVVEGGPGFARELATLFKRDDGGQSRWAMAMEKSDELSRRAQTWEDMISARGQTLGLHTSDIGSRYKDAKAFLQHVATKPLAVTDMMSSVPLWLARYEEMIADGHDEGTAVAEADATVRDTHGSGALTNKPQLTRGVGPVAASFGALYNVFSENMQKQFEVAWRTRDAYVDARAGDWSTFRENLPKIAVGVFTSVIVPALIEEYVTRETNDEREGWGHKAARILFNGLTSSVIGLRDIGRTLTSGYESGGGMIQTMEKAAEDPFKDIGAAMHEGRLSPERAGRLIRHAFVMAGMFTGLTNAEEGRMVEYAYRYNKGLERPKNPWQMTKGFVDGGMRRK